MGGKAMNEDRDNEGGAEEQAGPIIICPQRRTATAAGVVAIAAAVALGLALQTLRELDAHLDAEEREAAVPVRPDFGRR